MKAEGAVRRRCCCEHVSVLSYTVLCHCDWQVMPIERMKVISASPAVRWMLDDDRMNAFCVSHLLMEGSDRKEAERGIEG